MQNKQDFFLWVSAAVVLGIGAVIIGWSVLHYKKSPPILSQRELVEKNVAALQEVLPVPEAVMVSVASSLPDHSSRQQVQEMGKEMIRNLTDEEGNPLSQQEIDKRVTHLKEILQDVDKRREENEALKDDAYHQEENKRWRRKLPLHKSNLSFRGPKGEKPLSHEEITCPHNIENIREKEMVCYEYTYEGDVKSIFFFEDDMLCERDDLKNGRATVRYRFPPVPFYNQKNTPGYEGVLTGAVFLAKYYHPAYTYPVQEFYYSFGGMIATLTVRDFEKRQLESIAYDSNNRFYSYERSALSTDTENTFRSDTKSMRIEIYFPAFESETNPNPHVYFMEITDHGRRDIVKGKWTETEDHEVLLDIGSRFPPSTKFSYAQAPRYCDIYSKGCKRK